MKFTYNPTYYNNGKIFYNRNGYHESVKIFQLNDGIIIGIFQGSRGANPKLDFIVKQLEPGKKSKVRTPSHTHWIVDLLLKAEKHKTLVLEFVQFYIVQYNKLQCFKTISERNNCSITTEKIVLKKFSKLNETGNYSIQYLATIIELFIRCEKQTPKAFMFFNLLKLIENYCNGSKDYYSVVSLSKRV
ncbi:hypothetical protein [Gaetbulibacter saemankumensis]|uniref:hypothetical protein n=1 Tax=Gaetbulibacter saemankumensis TaxID=311208 RepID=UPI000400C679|nr:hypothetical protein [Gaetbulibacter saemankumensis]